MWDLWSLDFLYYPVSAVLWFWYKVFGWVLGPTNFLTWMLAVAFLVFTLRLILFPSFVKQVHTFRLMGELRPQIMALQRKYGQDRQRVAVEMQRLQREHGFNPLLNGIVPIAVKVVIFLALVHVLLSFNRTVHYFFHAPQMSAADNRATGNYVFSPADVGNFLDANVFGAPLSASMVARGSAEVFTELNRPAVIAVAVPLLMVTALISHLTAKRAVARQDPGSVNPQMRTANKVGLYVFPLGILILGPWVLLGSIVYLLANGAWTYGEQHYVFGALQREAEALRQEAYERRARQASPMPPPEASPPPQPRSPLPPRATRPRKRRR